MVQKRTFQRQRITEFNETLIKILQLKRKSFLINVKSGCYRVITDSETTIGLKVIKKYFVIKFSFSAVCAPKANQKKN